MNGFQQATALGTERYEQNVLWRPPKDPNNFGLSLVSDRKDGRHEPIRTADFWRVKPAMDPRLSNPGRD